MLNTLKIGDVTNTVSFNTPCTGLIQKSHPKSQFRVFHAKSDMAYTAFSRYPYFRESSTSDKEYIVVLQVMVFGDSEMLIEYVYEKDLKEEKE